MAIWYGRPEAAGLGTDSHSTDLLLERYNRLEGASQVIGR